VLQAIVRGALANGARAAAPGEFTLRAYLNGKLDLPQAEAVADLIDAVTPDQARAAFDQLNGTLTTAIDAIDAELFDLVAKLEASVDFPDEGYHFVKPGEAARAIASVVDRIDLLLASAARGRLVREGATVVLAGKPNAGKSSLFNRLVGADRAIVTDIPGTTRDLVTEVADLRGLRVTLVDTAGLTDSADPVEREGVVRANQAMASADLVLFVVDGTLQSAIDEVDEVVQNKQLTVINKCDIARHPERDAVSVSALSGAGIDDLVRRIHSTLGIGEGLDTPAVTNVRHIDLLEKARASLSAAASSITAAGGTLSEEFVLVDLQGARRLLEEISGVRTADDVLIHVFSRFCVGK
jgi:tRNA modification GTPase